MKSKIGAVVGCLAVVNSHVWGVGASGISNQMVGAKAMGQGNAFVAIADDPSALYFNPAGMTQLDGTRLSVGSALMVPMAKRSGEGVPDDKMKTQAALIPNFYVSHSLPQLGHRATIGLGLTSPFGVATQWAPTSSVRYVSTESNLQVVHVNPSLAVELMPSLSVGAGVDYVNLYNFTSKAQVNQAAANQQIDPLDNSSDASSNVSGHGNGWGFNLGLLYRPVEKHSLGLSYRSQVRVPIHGSLELSGLSSSSQANFNFASDHYTTDASGNLTLPASALVGYAFRPNTRWTLLADAEWTQWSVLDNQDAILQESDPSRLSFLTGNSANSVSRTARHWRNVIAIGTGANFKPNDTWQWRGGYTYLQRTAPTDTFSPDIPDSATHVLTAGFSRNWSSLVLDVAANGFWYADRHVSNSVGSSVGASVNGTYHVFAPALAFNLSYHF